MQRIDTLHVQNPYRGSRKLVKTLCDEGYSVSRKTVQRLMREMHIRAIYPKINLSKRNQKEAIMPYLLRNYEVILPNQVWSIDITYIAMPHGHMYLTAIIDWYSRKIVGHYLIGNDSCPRRCGDLWHTGNHQLRPRVPVHEQGI